MVSWNMSKYLRYLYLPVMIDNTLGTLPICMVVGRIDQAEDAEMTGGPADLRVPHIVGHTSDQ